CFDKSFTLFGIHQGRWLNGQTEKISRGVPIGPVIDHYRAQLSGGDLPDLAPEEARLFELEHRGEFPPVVGCDEFQRKVWELSHPGAPRLLVITGEPQTGKSLCLAVLEALLPMSRHIVLRIEASRVSKLPARQVTEQILRAAGTALPAGVADTA